MQADTHEITYKKGAASQDQNHLEKHLIIKGGMKERIGEEILQRGLKIKSKEAGRKKKEIIGI